MTRARGTRADAQIFLWGVSIRNSLRSNCTGIYICNRGLAISLDRWRNGQRNLHRSSPCLFRTVPTKFHLDPKEQFLYEFNVKKLVLLWFRGYLGEIESGKKKVRIFHIRFCFRTTRSVSGLVLLIFVPNLQWFTRYDLMKLSAFYGWPSPYNTLLQKKQSL